MLVPPENVYIILYDEYIILVVANNSYLQEAVYVFPDHESVVVSNWYY